MHACMHVLILSCIVVERIWVNTMVTSFSFCHVDHAGEALAVPLTAPEQYSQSKQSLTPHGPTSHSQTLSSCELTQLSLSTQTTTLAPCGSARFL